MPRDATTTLNGLRFHFLDWGTAGEAPLLLQHGGAQTAHSWDDVAPDFAADHHVLALDQRGHGDTDWAPVAAIVATTSSPTCAPSSTTAAGRRRRSSRSASAGSTRSPSRPRIRSASPASSSST
jgi:pimeloyl-ACP methyl ester carboxylesterase